MDTGAGTIGGRTVDRTRARKKAHRPQARCDAPPKGRKSPAIAFAHEALAHLGNILIHSGVSPVDLLREFRAVCARLPHAAGALNVEDVDFVADLPHVIALWYSDPHYLDPQGHPRALPFEGKSPSVAALIARVYPHRDTQAVLKKLLATGALRRKGNVFEPTKREIIFRSPSLGRLHALTPLMGFLKTVEHNLTHGRAHSMLEMTASNSRIPRSAYRALRARVHEGGKEFLFEVDDAMRQIEQRSPASQDRLRIGTCVFMYSTDEATAPQVGKRKVSRVHP